MVRQIICSAEKVVRPLAVPSDIALSCKGLGKNVFFFFFFFFLSGKNGLWSGETSGNFDSSDLFEPCQIMKHRFSSRMSFYRFVLLSVLKIFQTSEQKKLMQGVTKCKKWRNGSILFYSIP